jgi:molybdopterin-guanine dinucleotide biosynthesis protein A
LFPHVHVLPGLRFDRAAKIDHFGSVVRDRVAASRFRIRWWRATRNINGSSNVPSGGSSRPCCDALVATGRPCSCHACAVVDVSALILAGGKATRLGGVVKHELVIAGETIFARQLRVLAPRVAEVLAASPREILGVRTVKDPIEGAGPLAGIAAGLSAARTPWLIVVAGDMPYLTGDVVDALLAARRADVDAVCARAGGLAEPLLCVLHARVHAVLARRLAAAQYKASGLFTEEDLAVAWVDVADPGALHNINSPEDLQ